jgi:hypothetical protein
MESNLPDRLIRTEETSDSGAIKSRPAALDPLFNPTSLQVGRVAVPYAGKERHDGAGFDPMTLRGDFRLKRAPPFGDVDQLIGA